MALPQLPAHAQHQLGQRVIEQEHARASICKRAAQPCGSFRVCSLSSVKKESFSGKFKQSFFFKKFARSSRGGENPLFARYARVINNFRLPKQLTEHLSAPFGRNICFGRCVLRSLYSLRTIRPFRVDGMALPFHILLISSRYTFPQNTERRPRDHREMSDSKLL